MLEVEVDLACSARMELDGEVVRASSSRQRMTSSSVRAFLLVEVDPPAGNLVDDLLRVEQRHRIVRHDLVLHAVEFLLAVRHDVGDEPVIEQLRPIARTMTGATIGARPMPEALSASSSRSDDMRPKTIITAASSPAGMVSVRSAARRGT